MEMVYWEPGYISNTGGGLAALGTFDGVHLGHQVLIQSMVRQAQAINAPSLVVTFEPHPRDVISGYRHGNRLTPLSLKAKLFSELEVQSLVVMPFTEGIRNLMPEAFVRQVLLDSLKVKHIFVGENFRFGMNGTGDPSMLRLLGTELDFHVVQQPPVYLHEKMVSSTLIRDMLSDGQVEEAAKYLRRNYQISGKVIKGDMRGRTLGFPTANLMIDPGILVPAVGVYGVWVYHQGKRLMGMANIGIRPTFRGATELEIRLEVNILDFSADIYRDTLDVDFVFRVRDETMFSGPAALVAQLEKDHMVIRNRLQSAGL
jgi:riboflavin kinase/FMN adenylyltransferase